MVGTFYISSNRQNPKIFEAKNLVRRTRKSAFHRPLLRVWVYLAGFCRVGKEKIRTKRIYLQKSVSRQPNEPLKVRVKWGIDSTTHPGVDLPNKYRSGIDVSAATRCVRYTDELFFPDAFEIIFLNPSVSATTPATGARIARCATRQSKDRKSPQTSPQILPIEDLSTTASTPNLQTPNLQRHALNPFSRYSTVIIDF